MYKLKKIIFFCSRDWGGERAQLRCWHQALKYVVLATLIPLLLKIKICVSLIPNLIAFIVTLKTESKRRICIIIFLLVT
jgi:hypothetical protein